MDGELRILALDDFPADAELLRRECLNGGLRFTWCWISEREDYIRQLEEFRPDIIISDYQMPSFDGLSALRMAREKYPEIPFILMSGTFGEDFAEEALGSGVTDFVLKSRMHRLVPSIQRAVRELKERAARDRIEEQFRQAQKMEAVGRLAGGVAHDFNNMLAVILGYVDCVLTDIGDHPSRDDLVEIKNAAERSANLTRQLLAFARKQSVTPVVIDLNAEIPEMLNMLQRLVGEEIEISWKPVDSPWLVKMDMSQIDQIIANLLVNARDAIGGVGKVTIETGTTEFDGAPDATRPGMLSGEYVVLSVSDNGCGMDESTLAKLFEPFFTTKPQGEGTGLGLSTVYGIVKQNDGYVYVDSEPGRGTRFRIYLARHAPERRELLSGALKSKAQTGTETLLLVEDELPLLALGTRLLERLGYTVLGASTPGTAIQLAKDYGGEIQLVVSDVVMPEMNGLELYGELKSFRPDLKCIYVSGYTADILVSRGIVNGEQSCLQKPFTMVALSEKVRSTLDN